MIRNKPSIDELFDLIRYKNRLVIRNCHVVGEIEIFTTSDAAHPMFQTYSRRFAWKTVSGEQLPISQTPLTTSEAIWHQFGKFVFFHTVSRQARGNPLGARRRAVNLACALGVEDVPDDLDGAHLILIRRIDELLAPYVNANLPAVHRFNSDHIGPFTGSGSPITKEYRRLKNFVLPSDAYDFVLDREKGDYFPPTYRGPNGMRFAAGPFEGPNGMEWASRNLQTVC